MQCSICTHNPSSPPLYTHDSFFYQENVRCERKLIGYLEKTFVMTCFINIFLAGKQFKQFHFEGKEKNPEFRSQCWKVRRRFHLLIQGWD